MSTMMIYMRLGGRGGGGGGGVEGTYFRLKAHLDTA